MTNEERVLKDHDAIIDYELWRGNEMRDGKLTIKEFNDLVPEQLFKMYLEWNKGGRWKKYEK